MAPLDILFAAMLIAGPITSILSVLMAAKVLFFDTLLKSLRIYVTTVFVAASILYLLELVGYPTEAIYNWTQKMHAQSASFVASWVAIARALLGV